MEHLTYRITQCKTILPKTTEELENLSLKNAAALLQFVHTELEDMNRILMVDLYHVLGMGGLSANQLMQFTAAIMQYSKFRPILKTLEGNGLVDLNDLPKLSDNRKFSLLKLAPITLYTGDETTAKEEVEDCNPEETLTEIGPAPYVLEKTRWITIPTENLSIFLDDMNCSEDLLDTFKKKVANHSSYLGISWQGFLDGCANGKVSSPNTYIKIKKRLKEHYKVIV